MIGLIQRVSRASVVVDGETVGAIASGLLVLVAVQKGDASAQASRLADRLLTYRVFPDDAGRMNRNVQEAGGELLLVPQFTLAAYTDGGNRPGFEGAAAPAVATRLFDELVDAARRRGGRVHTGRFGANMAVELVNEGPVTFWLQVPPGPDAKP